MRSDATLFSPIPGENGADVEHSSRNKRRRTVLERSSTVSLPLHDPSAQELLSKQMLECKPPLPPGAILSPRPLQYQERSTALPASASSAGPSSGHVLLDVHAAPRRITSSPKQGDALCTSPFIPDAHDKALPKDSSLSGTHNSSVYHEPRLYPGSRESANACPSELSSRPAAPEGEVTRIEIAFEKFYQELLHCRDHDSLIREVAQRISTSPRWLEAYRAHKVAAGRALFCWGSGFRKIRFMDLMNVIMEEAPKFGLDVPYTHQLCYGRYHYDGSEWNPESENESSKSASRDSESGGAFTVYVTQTF